MTKLTRGLQAQIAAGIRAGGFGHVAAQAFRVSHKSYRRWRKLGRSNESDEPFRSFARDIDEALGQGRLCAEMKVFNALPRIWLEHGPGRETVDNPGWTVAVKPSARIHGEGNALMTRSTMELMEELMKSLTPYPDARADVARTIDRFKKK